jgi:hypothetical protein
MISSKRDIFHVNRTIVLFRKNGVGIMIESNYKTPSEKGKSWETVRRKAKGLNHDNCGWQPVATRNHSLYPMNLV